MVSLNIRIPDELGKRLLELSERTGRTKSYYVRAALEDQLDALEDCFLAMQSLEDIKMGRCKTWTQAELEAHSDLDS